MSRLAASIGLAFALALGLGGGEVAAQAQSDGQLTVAFDVSIALTFLDPAETPGIGVPFVFLYALHDALMKPLPGNDMAPCLAASWKESATGSCTNSSCARGSSSTTATPSRRRT